MKNLYVLVILSLLGFTLANPVIELDTCPSIDVCDACVEVVNDIQILVDNENFIKIISLICEYTTESREMCFTIIEQVAKLLREYSAEQVCTWLRLC